MLPNVETSGWMPLLIAAFSAGSPKASQPNGCRTLKPAHAARTRHHVADDVVADVPHVRVPGRVREHLEAVELRLGRVFGRLERAGVDPALLPLAVQFLRSILSHVKNYRPCHSAAPGPRARAASARSPRPVGRPHRRRRGRVGVAGQRAQREVQRLAERRQRVPALGDQDDAPVRTRGRPSRTSCAVIHAKPGLPSCASAPADRLHARRSPPRRAAGPA